MQNHYTSISLPVKVAQLVSANTGKCGPSKWHMVLNLNPATDDTLNLPGVGLLRAGQHSKVWVPMESPKGLVMEGSLVIIYVYIYIYIYIYILLYC